MSTEVVVVTPDTSLAILDVAEHRKFTEAAGIVDRAVREIQAMPEPQNDADAGKLNDLIAVTRVYADRTKEMRAAKVAPIDAEKKRVTDLFDPILTQFAKLRETARERLANYLAAKTLPEPSPLALAPRAAVEGTFASTKLRYLQRARVSNVALLSRELLEQVARENEKAVTAIALSLYKNGVKDVPGVEFFEEPTTYTSAAA